MNVKSDKSVREGDVLFPNDDQVVGRIVNMGGAEGYQPKHVSFQVMAEMEQMQKMIGKLERREDSHMKQIEELENACKSYNLDTARMTMKIGELTRKYTEERQRCADIAKHLIKCGAPEDIAFTILHSG